MEEDKTFDSEKAWQDIEKGVTKLKIFLQGNQQIQFDVAENTNLYTAVYNLCIIQKSSNDEHLEKLYNNYVGLYKDYLNSIILPCLREKHMEFMLKALLKNWRDYEVMMKFLCKIFHYLSRYFLVKRSLPPLRTAGIQCFRDGVYTEFREIFLNIIVTLIEQEREGNQIDRSLLKNFINIYVDVGLGEMEVYEKDFELGMLDDTSSYYSRKSSKWILEDSCPDYMMKVEECLKKEKKRVFNYLHSSSEEKLIKRVQHELLSVHSTQLLEKEQSGCLALLRNDKIDDLHRMFRLFNEIPGGLDPVANIFRQYVTGEGKDLVRQAEEDSRSGSNNNKKEKGNDNLQAEHVFVRKAIELHDKYLDYVTRKCFMNHSLFHKSLKEAFEGFINKNINGNSSAEILATFCDTLLKKANTGDDQGLDETLEKVVKLLAFVTDKDLFAEFCRKKLGRRLLFDRNSDDDYEKSLLTKLKQQCGGQFTSKMEGMVTDMTLAKDIQFNFSEYVRNNNNPLGGIDLSVMVLTTGFWPSYKSFDFNIPAEMAKCVGVFRDYYTKTTSKRRLTWIYSLGSCTLIGKFEQKTIELVVSTTQASTLMLFNDSDKLSYEEIKSQLNVSSDEDIVRLLHSLSCGKYKILNKKPANKIISHGDVFEFNAKFTDKMRRIKIPLPMVSVEEKKKILEDVDKDRRYIIDAAIVRIMKSEKILGYQELVMQCIEQVGMFKPEIRVIKRRIEDLLSRDYLERDKENSNVFKYVA